MSSVENSRLRTPEGASSPVKWDALVVGTLVLAGVFYTFTSFSVRVPTIARLRTPTGTSISVEVANTPEARSLGLSERDELAHDGLLLKWDHVGPHAIWMAGMRFSLDVVWLDEGGRVLAVAKSAMPCQQRPCPLLNPPEAAYSKSVLELPAGGADRHGFELGTRVVSVDH